MLHSSELYLLDPTGRSKFEQNIRQMRSRFPIAQIRGPLGRAFQVLMSKNDLKRQWLLSGVDPNLELDIAAIERQMMARDAAHITFAYVKRVLYFA